MISYFFVFLQLLFVIYLVYYIVAFLSGAPFVPTTNPTARVMIEVSGLKKGMIAYDLGSGEGKLLKHIASSGATAIGIEINPLLVLYTKIRFMFSPLRHRISIRLGSFWNVSLTDANVLFVYLLPLRMKKLEEKIINECRPGTYIVSNSFEFPRLKKITEDRTHHVFVYKLE